MSFEGDVCQDYARILLEERPLMDTRAPVEFAQGAFPGAVNLPLLDDRQRARVGTCYKHQGPEAALRLGYSLVSGSLREARLAAWQAFAERHPDGYLYCFRGGQRSRIVQAWLAERGCHYPRISGGYKAMRRFLMAVTEQQAGERPWVVLGGRTGTGKTEVLKKVSHSLDLEGLAHHRGSSFGRRVLPQPPQIGFENALGVALLRWREADSGPLLLEDEGRMIGRINLPLGLKEAMAQAPLILLEKTLSERVDQVLEDYVCQLSAEYQAHYASGEPDGGRDEERGLAAYAEYMLASLDRIRKRLGGARHQAIRELMEAALNEHCRSGDIQGHRRWIEPLLRDYYDPMYDYQLRQKEERVRCRGSEAAIRDWFASYRASSVGD